MPEHIDPASPHSRTRATRNDRFDGTEDSLRSDQFLGQAMRTWGDTVLRLALNQLHCVADAEDVFQDVFLRLLKDQTAFSSPEHLKAWLIRVTVNRCHDVGRSGWKRKSKPLDETHLAIEAPDLFASDIWQSVEELSFNLRTVIYLFYVEGYSTEEIAHLTDCQPSTARTRLHRARVQLKEILERADKPIPKGTPTKTEPRHTGNSAQKDTSSGKEDRHGQRSVQRVRFPDAEGEGFRPFA